MRRFFFSSASDLHKPTAVPQTEYYRQKAVLIYMRNPNGADESLDSGILKNEQYLVSGSYTILSRIACRLYRGKYWADASKKKDVPKMNSPSRITAWTTAAARLTSDTIENGVKTRCII